MPKVEAAKPLTTHEAASYCGTHHSSVIRWIDQGKLKAYRTPGGHRRVLPRDLADFLKRYGMPAMKPLNGHK